MSGNLEPTCPKPNFLKSDYPLEISLSEFICKNAEGDRRLIYQLTQRGFTSELNNLLLALLYCLEHRIEFRLSSRYWGAANSKGWVDYFLPFCKESNNRFVRIGTITRLPQRIKKRQQLYKALRPGTLFTHDIWSAVQNPAFLQQTFTFSQLGINGDIFQAKAALLNHVFRPNATSAEIIRQLTITTKTPYAALHIRRGDKLVSEAKSIDIEAYITALKSISSHFEHIYIATDDYSVVEETKSRFPEYTIHSLCSKDQRGYSQSNFNSANREQKKAETLHLLADLENIRKAHTFIGTYSSNVGRFAALLKGLENCISMDDEWHPL